MKKTLFSLSFLLISVLSFSQTAQEMYDKGIALKDKENCTEALEAFKKAISLDPGLANAYFYAGWCCNDLGNYEDALNYLNKFNPINDEDKAEKYVEIGYAKTGLDKKEEAIEAYKKVLDYKPNYGVAYRALGKIYYDDMQDEDALTNFELAMKYDEENSKQYYYTLGWLYNEMSEYTNALDILKKAIVYEPDNDKNFTELGYAYLHLDKYNDGITALQKAIQLNDSASFAYHYLGNCYMGLQQKAKAMEVYNKLKNIDADEAELLLKEIEGKE